MHRLWYLITWAEILLFSLEQVTISLSISILILKMEIIIILKLLRRPNEIRQSACHMVKSQKTSILPPSNHNDTLPPAGNYYYYWEMSIQPQPISNDH